MIFKTNTIIMVLVMLCALSMPIQGARLNSDNVRDHGAWKSMKLSLGDYRFYRAINADDYSDLRILIDFDSQNCEPELKMHLDNDRSFDKDESLGFRETAIRVDRKPIHDSLMKLSTNSGDETIYGNAMVGDLSRLIAEMRLGRTLRFKFFGRDDNSDPFYAELTLTGSKAALDRAATLCKQDQPRPEDYFEGNGTLPQEDAEDYF